MSVQRSSRTWSIWRKEWSIDDVPRHLDKTFEGQDRIASDSNRPLPQATYTEATCQVCEVSQGTYRNIGLSKTILTHVTQNPTRKIYMLFHLEPSVEMTGGPWYTDNELDSEFIKLLCSACLRFIRDRVR